MHRRALVPLVVVLVALAGCESAPESPVQPEPETVVSPDRLQSGTVLGRDFDFRTHGPVVAPETGPVEGTLSLAGEETITFDEFPAPNDNDAWISDEYAAQGVTFVTEDAVVRDGLLDGDPGNWGITGTNGDQFLGLNGPTYSVAMEFAENVVQVVLDVSRSNGSQDGDAVQVTARCDGDLVDGLGQPLGPIDDWTTFTVSAPCIDQVTVLGIGDAFHPYGIDNLRITYQPLDSDGDGVPDEDDICPDTEIPDPVIPMRELGVNRYALVDEDGTFDTRTPRGNGPEASFTVEDTGGCNAGQIADALGLGNGHYKFGLSLGVLQEWVEMVGGDA